MILSENQEGSDLTRDINQLSTPIPESTNGPLFTDTFISSSENPSSIGNPEEPQKIDESEGKEEQPCCDPCGTRSGTPGKTRKKRKKSSTSKKNQKKKKKTTSKNELRLIEQLDSNEHIEPEKTESRDPRGLCYRNCKCPCKEKGVYCKPTCRGAKLGLCENQDPELLLSKKNQVTSSLYFFIPYLAHAICVLFRSKIKCVPAGFAHVHYFVAKKKKKIILEEDEEVFFFSFSLVTDSLSILICCRCQEY